jgi:hypothetical protein
MAKFHIYKKLETKLYILLVQYLGIIYAWFTFYVVSSQNI